MNNLLIIGNGFDLAHNLKTQYTDFINHILNSHLADREKFNSIINLNANITTTEQIKEYAYNTPVKRMHQFPNKFFGILLSNYNTNNWCEIEKIYYSVLNLDNNRYNNVNEFHKDFEEIKNYLSEYLNSLKFSSLEKDGYKYLFDNLIIGNSLLLNFNYTNTLENYSTKNHVLSSKNIINIHGELNSEENPIIFGFAANDDESRVLINKDDKEYMRYIKKHCYKRTNNERNLKFYLDKNEKINVFILGHSCGVSDKLILNQIFNHQNIESIRVFYYKEYEKFFETQVNIDRIMNNDKNFKKLKSYLSSTRMPQIDDSNEEENDFIEYIDEFIKSQETYTMSDPSVF